MARAEGRCRLVRTGRGRELYLVEESIIGSMPLAFVVLGETFVGIHHPQLAEKELAALADPLRKVDPQSVRFRSE